MRHATGGGWGVCVTRGLQRGGHKIFSKNDSFWRFAPLLQKRQKLSTFQKNFCFRTRCKS